jgi:hypothetical protein
MRYLPFWKQFSGKGRQETGAISMPAERIGKSSAMARVLVESQRRGRRFTKAVLTQIVSD